MSDHKQPAADSVRTRIVDLGQFRDKDVHVYSGRERGRVVRQSARLDELDQDPSIDQVIIRVPKDTWDVASSFWLGMFGDSVRKLRGEAFRSRYRFEGGILPEDVEAGIQDALFEENPLATAPTTGSWGT